MQFIYLFIFIYGNYLCVCVCVFNCTWLEKVPRGVGSQYHGRSQFLLFTTNCELSRCSNVKICLLNILKVICLCAHQPKDFSINQTTGKVAESM